MATERVEDFADVLAYHYSTAIELAQAAGQADQATELEASALKFLSLAGERALGLDTPAALSNFERALALAPVGHPERPEALARFGEAAFQAGRYAEASEALNEAIASFRRVADFPAAARAMGRLAYVLGRLGDPRRWSLPVEAVALLEPLGRSFALAGALTELARSELIQGRLEESVRTAERALTLGDELGVPPGPSTLSVRGMASAALGDPAGLEDMREAIELATRAGQGEQVANTQNYLGLALWSFEGPTAGLESLRDGIAFSRSRGLAELVEDLTGSTLDVLVDRGEFDEALDVSATIAARVGEDDLWHLSRRSRRRGPRARPAWRGFPGSRFAPVDRVQSPRGSGGGQLMHRTGVSAIAWSAAR